MLKKLLEKMGYYKCDWGSACGRQYLIVNGYVVAVEGDVCRDEDLSSMVTEDEKILERLNVTAIRPAWNLERIKAVLNVK